MTPRSSLTLLPLSSCPRASVLPQLRYFQLAWIHEFWVFTSEIRVCLCLCIDFFSTYWSKLAPCLVWTHHVAFSLKTFNHLSRPHVQTQNMTDFTICWRCLVRQCHSFRVGSQKTTFTNICVDVNENLCLCTKNTIFFAITGQSRKFLRFVYKLMRTVFEVDVTVLDDLGAYLLNSCPWLPVNFRIDCRDISWFTKLSEVRHHNIFLTLWASQVT